MKKQQISFENYTESILQVDIYKLPKLLQKGHQFFLEAQEFYDQETEIKETIDLYLEQLNDYLAKSPKVQRSGVSVSISFIRSFLKMHRTVQSKKNLKQYIFALQKAVSNREITKEDPNASHILEIQKKLIYQYNEMILADKVKIMINRKWRLQLQSIVKESSKEGLGDIPMVLSTGTDRIPKGITREDPLFTTFDQKPVVSNRSTFRLPGAIGELLGDLEKFELAITIEGDQGGGKTRFTYQLADAFAEIGNKIAIFTLEIGGKSDLINRMREEYLSPQNRNRISKADRLPDGFNTIASAAGTFDVIIIDSWNKTGLPSQDFDKLRKQFPDTIFVVIFQRTTGKTIRGGTAPLFDAGINIEVVKVDETFKNNYAITTKNRYGITGIKYNIRTKQIQDAQESASRQKEQLEL
ncbi:hypothetical protein [Aquimarina agarilytica]|uniref:hypothetical protein n=1 Tax=Aquimarina agarilytica TaxID=1087449 RepID=UPI000288E839|nr:hypothetical protein [Aquimarina agarilytica]